jgi:nucleoside-diphosphate-sugar epimerase
MRIALVGGAGFIGHHLALRLRKEGHDVLILDHEAVNNRANVLERRHEPWSKHYLKFIEQREDLWNDGGCEFRQCNACNYHVLSQRLAEWNTEAIVHLAAVAHITHTRSDQHHAFENSIITLKNALDVAHAVQAKRFVYFSSSTVYGNFRNPIVDEESGVSPDTTYGAYKLAGELFVKSATRDRGISHTIIRPQALYGPRCVSRRVTQVFLENALDQKPLRIDGDGSASHDFTHIDDLTAGISGVFHRFDESHNQTFCLTAGQARSLRELAEIVNNNIGCRIEYGPPDPEKPSRGTMSPDKAHRLLDWKPRIGLDAGMAMYTNWYKEYFNAAEIRKVPRYDVAEHQN